MEREFFKNLILKIAGLAFVATAMFAAGAPAAYAAGAPAAPAAQSDAVKAFSEFSNGGGGALNVVNCADYLNGASIKMNLAASAKGAIVPGAAVDFGGTVVNGGKHPIVDGALYAKIYKKTAAGARPGAGDQLVDEFYAVKNLAIPAGASTPVSFSWKLPNWAQSGDYYLASYFIVADKFALSGVPYADGLPGGESDFKVYGAQSKAVVIDRSSVKVDGAKYDFGSFSPIVDASKPITVSFNIVNNSGAAENVPVTYVLHGRDNLSDSAPAGVTSELVSIPAGASKSLTYTIKDNSVAVYELTAAAQYNDAKSMIDVRVARGGEEDLTLDYLALGAYPLAAGKDNLAAACASNGGGGTVSDGKLVISVLDGAGNTIASGSYSGLLSGIPAGFAKIFRPVSLLTAFSVKAELYQGGKLADSATLVYDCKALAPDSCGAGSGSGALTVVVIVVIVATLIIILAILDYDKKRKGER